MATRACVGRECSEPPAEYQRKPRLQLPPADGDVVVMNTGKLVMASRVCV